MPTNFSRNLSFAIFFLPIALVAGPLIAEIVMGYIVIMFLYFNFKNKNFEFYNFFFCYIWLGLYFIIFISLIINNAKFDQFISHFFYFRFLVLAIAIKYAAENYNFFFIFLRKFLIIFFIILSCDLIFQYYFKINFIGLALINENRPSSFFGEELIAGSFLSRFFPILLGLLFINKKINTFDLFLMILVFFAVFLSGERLALFYVFLTFFLGLLFIKYSFIRKIYFLLILFFLIILLFSSNSFLKERILNQGKLIAEKTINSLLLKKNLNVSGSEMVYAIYYNSSLKMFLDKPFLGHGIKSYRNICKDKKYKILHNELSNCSTHPHNTYFQLLAETGIVSFFIVLSLFIYSIYSCFKYLIIGNENYNYKIFFYISIIINLWPLGPSGNFYNNWLSIIYYFCAAFSLINLKISKK